MNGPLFHNRGFTLIELLVVISIIGLLASIVLVSLNRVRTKARNARRLADMKQIQTALELYFDENGRYPIDNDDGGGCGCDYSHIPSANPDFISILIPTYLPSVVLDPVQNPYQPNLVYGYRSDDGSTYYLMFNMEPTGIGTNCPTHAPASYPPSQSQPWCTLQP